MFRGSPDLAATEPCRGATIQASDSTRSGSSAVSFVPTPRPTHGVRSVATDGEAMRMAENVTASTTGSQQEELLMQSDKMLGVMMACTTGLVTVCGALVVYSNRLAYMWEPRSLVVALGLATGGVLFFTLVELLPLAQQSLEDLLESWDESDDTESMGDPLNEGYASLMLAGAFAMGVIMVWVMDTLCMYCALPTKLLHSSRDLAGRSTGHFNTRSPTRTTARGQTIMLQSSAEDHLAKELLYKTGTARVAAFAVQNIPEGMGLCIATNQSRTLGILFACAVSLLNFTQGMALAGLLTQASGFRWRAVLWCVFAALALPLGGFLSWAVLLQTELDALALGVFYGLTGGILVGMCLTQILTVCYNHKTMSDNNPVTTSVLGGVVLLAGIRALLAFLYV